ncbi:MAG: phosphoglucosamine mutase [Deltaproteobacteria bacterium]|nr:phosphoglucosamine mutase [Deltaproteobacteria bacterium]
MAREWFGTDGIRGLAGQEPMSPEMALRVGRALSELVDQGVIHGAARKPGHRPRIVIGKDTRLSGYMLENALASGIIAQAVDVLLVGPLPTPGIAFITRSMRADAALVVSASHNPFEDNGIKIFAGDGFKLPDDVEERLEGLIRDGALAARGATHKKLGRAFRVDDAVGRYVVFLKATFPDELSLDGLKVVVDCAHGAAYRVAPEVFRELGADVTELAVEPDGLNINDQCGALHPATLQGEVRKHGADIGIALDGDADRVIVVDEKGEVVDGDQIMAACARELIGKGALAHNTLVATVMSNIGLDRYLKALGGNVVRTPVGDRYVVEEMRRGGFTLGGEQSGHLIFLDHTTTGDGVVAALSLLSLMVREGKPLSQLTRAMEVLPQKLVSFPVKAKKPLEELGGALKVVQDIEKALGEEGRVLVRYSGTENKARVLVEGADAQRIGRYADEIAEAIRVALG